MKYQNRLKCHSYDLSLPSWECGLKSPASLIFSTVCSSLPSWECGLKSGTHRGAESPDRVAPFVGVWIEIGYTVSDQLQNLSLPSWECGLKFVHISQRFAGHHVAPFVGVWIEIFINIHFRTCLFRRSLRGSVD